MKVEEWFPGSHNVLHDAGHDALEAHMARITQAAQIANLTQVVENLAAAVAGQFATPTLVAVKVAESKPVADSASDKLKAHVEAAGFAFARGGRTVLSFDGLTAAVRVLKTGTPEILPVTEALGKRGVVGLAIGRDGKGKEAHVITQYLYKPDAV